MMHNIEDALMELVATQAPQLQTGMVLFSKRRAIAQAMMQTMSDELMKVERERAEWDREKELESNHVCR